MTQSVIFGAVPSGSGAQVRADFNTSDRAAATQHSGATAPSPTYSYMLWRRTTDNDLLIRNTANTGWEILEHYATVNPAVGDDIADGYTQGSFWFNTTGHSTFVCNNPAAGAASWAEIAAGGGGGGGVATVFGRTGTVVATTGDYTAAQVSETSVAKIMTGVERTKLGLINTYWAARTATDPAAIVKNVSIGAHDLRRLLIFYGTRGSINGGNNADHSAAQLSQYDDVVLGYGLQDPAHGSYASTVSIISKTKTLNPNITIWGNIDLGVSGGTSHNHSTGTLQTHIDQWVTAGATGIFADNFGYNFAVTRARQNTIVAYCHGKPIPIMAYPTTMADALSSAVVATYNASGTAEQLDSRDASLFMWAFDSVNVAAPHFTAFATMKSRADEARTFRGTMGVRMFGNNVLSFTGRTLTDTENYRGIAEALGHIWRLDGFGLSLDAYSATSGVDDHMVKPYQSKILPQPGGRKTAVYLVNGASTEVEASDLGIVVHYESGQYTWSAPSYSVVVQGGGGGTGTPFGLTPPSVQTANGSPPNADCVLLKGAVSSVSLLTVATSRWVQVFVNLTAQTVILTASEGINGYPSGFGIPSMEAVNIFRDPDDNSIWIS